MASTTGLLPRRHRQLEFPYGNNFLRPIRTPVFFVTQTKSQGSTHQATPRSPQNSTSTRASELGGAVPGAVAGASPFAVDDGLEMLTACPKCQHVLTSPAPPAGTAGLELRMQDTSSASATTSCCAPTAITVRVPGWTTGGGSVVLQAVPGAGGKTGGEPSPSVPLSFVLPTTPTVILAGPGPQWSFLLTPPVQAPPQLPSQPLPQPHHYSNNGRLPPQSDLDLHTLTATQTALRTSGWYYEGLSWQESASLLLPTSAGTFLVRDSSDPRYLFSLSVQTERGPTSVRLHYADGRFRLDAESKIIPLMPLFDCVVKLVQHYTDLTSKTADITSKTADPTSKNGSRTRRKRSSKDQLLIDASGQVYSHILLTSPLRQKDRFPSLMHLSRLAVNRIKSSSTVPIGTSLPLSLQTYLRDYPYIC